MFGILGKGHKTVQLLVKKLTFFLIVALIGIFALVQYKNQIQEDEERTQGRLLIKQVKQDDIVEVSLNFPSQSIQMLRQGEKWILQSPIKDRADTRKVEDLIYDLLKEQGQLIENHSDWSEYDLEHPSVTIHIRTQDQTIKLDVSAEPNFNKDYFIRKDNKLYLGDKHWTAYINQKSSSLLDQRIFTDGTINYLSVKHKRNRNLIFNLKNDKWIWKSNLPLSRKKVNRYWKLLQRPSLRITSQKKGAVQKQARWRTPDLQVSVKLSDQKKKWLKMNLKDKDTRAEVITSNRPYVYEIKDQKLIQQFLEKDFRDHQAPFDWPLNELHEVKIKANTLDVHIRNNPKLASKDQPWRAQWEVLKPANHQVNKRSWEQFLDWIAKLEATGYYQQASPLNGDQIELKDKKGNRLLFLQFASTFDSKDRKKQIYLKSNKNKKWLSIDHSLYIKALSSALIEKKLEE